MVVTGRARIASKELENRCFSRHDGQNALTHRLLFCNRMVVAAVLTFWGFYA